MVAAIDDDDDCIRDDSGCSGDDDDDAVVGITAGADGEWDKGIWWCFPSESVSCCWSPCDDDGGGGGGM